MRISVVIAAYNEEKLIDKCLHAVKNQTFPRKDYEILVIDNNSIDKTAELAKKLGARVLSYREKQGFSVAKQYGAEQARGEIVVFTDADSIPDIIWLESIDKLMQDKKLVCVGGPILSSENSLMARFLFYIYDLFVRLNQFFGILLVWGPNYAVRKKEFKQIGGINTRLRTSDDWELTLRIQKNFGIRSVLYSKSVVVRTSPRKQKSLRRFIPYLAVGTINYIFIFILRKSKTFGKPANIR
jgi:glycosyltransferase involved in cell wall biosynthesis